MHAAICHETRIVSPSDVDCRGKSLCHTRHSVSHYPNHNSTSITYNAAYKHAFTVVLDILSAENATVDVHLACIQCLKVGVCSWRLFA